MFPFQFIWLFWSPRLNGESTFLKLITNFMKLQVLTNGIEVKLQRNALSVIEAPTGQEDDDDIEYENMQWNGSDMGEFFDWQTSHKHCFPETLWVQLSSLACLMWWFRSNFGSMLLCL